MTYIDPMHAFMTSMYSIQSHGASGRSTGSISNPPPSHPGLLQVDPARPCATGRSFTGLLWRSTCCDVHVEAGGESMSQTACCMIHGDWQIY